MQKTEILIHEGVCIHYEWNAEAVPPVTITSVKRGDVEMLNVLEYIGTTGDTHLAKFTAAVMADNEGRE